MLCVLEPHQSLLLLPSLQYLQYPLSYLLLKLFANRITQGPVGRASHRAFELQEMVTTYDAPLAQALLRLGVGRDEQEFTNKQDAYATCPCRATPCHDDILDISRNRS